MRRKFSLTVLFALVTPIAATVQVLGEGRDADREWAELSTIWDSAFIGTKDRVEFFKKRELLLREFRDKGLAFYESHPKDNRRWEWLLMTLASNGAPRYWSDVHRSATAIANNASSEVAEKDEIDHRAAEAWEETVNARLRPEFFNSPSVTSLQRAQWHHNTFYSIGERGGKTVKWGDVASFVLALQAYAAETAVQERGEESSLPWAINVLDHMFRTGGLSLAEQQVVIEALQANSNAVLRKYAAGLANITKLRTDPLELRLRTLDGRQIDLAAMRGHVILVDFWSTGCSSCIDAMPKLKALHRRYQSDGFEIVSVSMDRQRDRKKLEAVLQRIEPTWSTAWEPWETTALRERFAITGFPVYFLLNRDGRLVGRDYDGDEGGALLEQDVRRLLLEPSSTESSKAGAVN